MKSPINTILISIVIVLQILSFVYIPNKIKDNQLEMEYAKVWGKDNYDLLTKAQAIQLSQQIPQIKEFVESVANTGATNVNQPTSVNNQQDNSYVPVALEISEEKLKELTKNQFVDWDKSAKLTLVEYSDLECPFCIRQAKDWIIDSLLTEYGKDVNHVFKNIQWAYHQNAKDEAVASMCAWKLWGVDSYKEYYNTIFDRTQGGGTGFDLKQLTPLAVELGLKEKEFASCLTKNKDEFYKQYDLNTEEANNFGVWGTPATLIVNNETKKYVLVSGARPLADFKKAIDFLLQNK